MKSKVLYKLLSVAIFLLCTTIGCMIASHIVAAHYTELGTPFISIGKWQFYSPISVFRWQELFYKERTLAKLVYAYVIGGIFTGLSLSLVLKFIFFEKTNKRPQNIFGDATFAKRSDLLDLKLIGKGNGIFLGKTDRGEYIRHNAPGHYAVIAPTRSGKGTGIVIPTLLTWTGSCVIYDLKEENFQRTAGRRSEFSDILYFNPNSINSAHFNPLFEIRPGLYEVRDTQNIANMIIEPDKPGVSDHWVRTGNSLLTAAILHVLYTSPAEEKNLAGVAALLSRPNKTLTETLHEMLATRHIRDKDGKPLSPHLGVVSAARDVLNKSADDRSSVVSTVMGYLSVYRDPLLANCTKDSDFTIDDLVNSKRPKSLFLVIPASDIERLRPIIRIIVNLICRKLTEQAVKGSKNQEHNHKLLLMLDEFLKLGRLEVFESSLGFLAGYGITSMLIMQSLSEVWQVYGQRTSLLDNTGVKVFYRPETLETAEYLSKAVGTTTIEYKTKGESGKKGSPFFSSASESLHFASRQLLTPREILDLPQDESLLFVGGAKPIRAKKIIYFEDKSFTALLKAPPDTQKENRHPYKSSWFDTQYLPTEKITNELAPYELIVSENKPSENEAVPEVLNDKEEDFDDGDLV